MKKIMKKIDTISLASAEFAESAVVLDLKTEGRYWRTSKTNSLFLIFRLGEEVCLEGFLAEKEADEYDILVEAAPHLEGPGALITYNGDSFALPHLRKKYAAYGLPVPFERKTSLDLLKTLRPLRDILGLPSGKLGHLAAFLQREGCLLDASSPNADTEASQEPTACRIGASSSNAEILEADVLTTFSALSLLSLLRFLRGGFAVSSVNQKPAGGGGTDEENGFPVEEEPFLSFSLLPKDPLAVRLHFSEEGLRLIGEGEAAALRVRVREGCVRLYFPDFQHYDYLPLEGYAVHKSVSQGVAADRKQPATRETCFSLVPVKTILENPKAALTLARNAVGFLAKR